MPSTVRSSHRRCAPQLHSLVRHQHRWLHPAMVGLGLLACAAVTTPTMAQDRMANNNGNSEFLASDAALAADTAMGAGRAGAALMALQQAESRWLGDPAFDAMLLRAATAAGREDVASMARGRLDFFAPGHPALGNNPTAAGDQGRMPALTAAADDPAALAQLADLVASQAWPQAWLVALHLAPDWEGDPEFDYLFGQAALQTGHAGEATFAFQRALAKAPDDVRLRSHLARALYASGDLNWARQEFNQVLDAQPPADVRQRVEDYLGRIRKRERARYTSVALRLQPSYGYDSNVNTGTDATLVDTLFGALPLPAGSRAQGDTFRRLRGQVTVRVPLDRNRGLGASLAADVKDNEDLDAFDTAVFLAQAEAWQQLNSRDRVSLGVRGTLVHLDDDVLRESAGLNLGWQRLGPGWLAELSAGADALRFPDDDSRDADEFSLGAALSLQQAPLGAANQRFNLLARHNSNQGGADFLGYDALQLGWQGIWALGVHSAHLQLAVQGRRYDSSHPIFLEQREDLGGNVSAGWTWQISPGLSLATEVGYQYSESNIDTFDLDRALAEAGLRLAL